MGTRVGRFVLLAIAGISALPLRPDDASAATITIDLVAGSDPLGNPVVDPPGGMLSHFETLGAYGTVEAGAAASVTGWKTSFETFAESANTVGALARALLSVDQADTVAVAWGAPPASLTFRFLVTGVAAIGPLDGDGKHVGSLIVNGTSYDLSVPGPIADPNEFAQVLINVPVPLTGPWTPFSIQVQSECATLTQNALCHADFTSTLELVAVLLPGGQTPESQGMALQFGSGLPSPNLDGIAASQFDVDSEGWRVGDLFTESPNAPAARIADGGNPGGFLRTGDAYSWNAYHAPPAFLGDQSAAYGGVLHVEQRVLGSNGVLYPMVVISDGTLLLQFRTDPPGTSWTPYDIPLVASAGWEIAKDSSGSPGLPASEAQLRQVLGRLAFLHFDADWRDGTDQVDLDNVRLMPEPSSAALLLCGVAGVLGCDRVKRRRGTS